MLKFLTFQLTNTNNDMAVHVYTNDKVFDALNSYIIWVCFVAHEMFLYDLFSDCKQKNKMCYNLRILDEKVSFGETVSELPVRL